MNDDDELPLFAKGLVRSSDPDTSHHAAERLNVSRLEALVESVLRSVYPEGLNWAELSRHPVMIEARVDPQSISPRMRRLVEKGRAEDTGTRRMGHKRSQIVWRWVPPS